MHSENDVILLFTLEYHRALECAEDSVFAELSGFLVRESILEEKMWMDSDEMLTIDNGFGKIENVNWLFVPII